ncbi:Glutathione-regulated potassium-efflux system protein KefC, partial [Haemophilus influenzae]
MNPLFRLISKARIREMMTAGALLVVLGAALAMEIGGLSMAMGAFVAGVMMSESAFRHQLEADIEPFRGLLLGLFFMGVGMSLDLHLVFNHWILLLGIVFLYILGKASAVYIIARITRLDHREAIGRMSLMAHGGEFAFVLFSAAATAEVISNEEQATFTAAVIISMLFSPIIAQIARKLIQRTEPKHLDQLDENDLDTIGDLEDNVLVIGFGRFSQIVCQTLLIRGISVSVIDRNIENIRAAAKFGFKVYYGDGIRLDVLRAAG